MSPTDFFPVGTRVTGLYTGIPFWGVVRSTRDHTLFGNRVYELTLISPLVTADRVIKLELTLVVGPDNTANRGMMKIQQEQV